MMEIKKSILPGVLISLAPAFLPSCQEEVKQPLNVLFISVDDLRPALGCYGDPLATTPNIDRLAGQGVMFAHHYVQAPSSAPSRTSMLTGLRPDEVRVTNHKTHFRDTRPEVVTLPQFFRNRGYTTISLGKIFHYAKGYNDSISWDKEYFLKGYMSSYALTENREAGGKAASTEFVDAGDTAYLDGIISRKAMEYLREFKQKKTPFFLGVGFLKPHLPFTAPQKYWDMQEGKDFGKIRNPDRPLNAPEIAFHHWQELRGYKDIPREGPLTPEKETELRRAYYACVSYIDAQVGKILDLLDELDLRKNTIVVLWGDHGYHLGEQDLWCKSTNFEIAARSPLIISAPGVSEQGSICNKMVESLDIYPTILESCGYEHGDSLSGKSLVPFMNEQDPDWENIAYNQFARPYEAAIGARVPVTHMGYSVRVEGWRYTAWYNVKTKQFEYPELYRMGEDKANNENLAGEPEFLDIQKRLNELLVDYRSRMSQESKSAN